MRRLLLTLTFTLATGAVAAQSTEDSAPTTEPPMTITRLSEIVRVLDADAVFSGPTMQFTIADIPVILVADPLADRMRAMVPIRSADGLDADELMRLMQANFDTALDARYAVAQGRLWGVFIHPLSPLERDQFVSGIAQTVNVARTYGQTYSGGAQVYGGGDSSGIYEELLEELRKIEEL